MISQRTLFHPPGTPSEDASNPLRPSAILAALRRRWFPAALMGLLLGGGAAAAVWYFVPTPYTAFGELEVQSTRFFWRTTEADAHDGARELESYKREMMRRLADPFVINAALLNTEIADCPTLQGVENKDLWLESNLAISSSGQQFIRVSLSGDRPNDLKLIVNGVIQAFETEVILGQSLERKRNLEEMKEVAQELAAGMAETKSEIDRLARTLESANDEQSNLLVQAQEARRNQLLFDLVKIQMDRIRSEVQLATLEAAGPPESNNAAADDVDSDPEVETPDDASDTEKPHGMDEADPGQETVPDDAGEDGPLTDTLIDNYLLSEDPEFRDLYRRERDQQILVDLYRMRVGPESELRVTAESELVELQEELSEYRDGQIPRIRALLYEGVEFGGITAAQLQNEIDTFKAYEEQLQERLDEEESAGSRFATSFIEQGILADEYAEAELRYDALDEEIFRREMEIENGSPPIEVYYEAKMPRVPDKAKRLKLASVAGMATFAVAAALILWLDLRTQRIDTADEVEAGLQLPLIGSIPIVPRSVNGASSSSTGRRTKHWQNMLTESVDSARIILLQRAKDDGLKTIMITSATGGEGKTTLSCHLATSLARASQRVLLIDCDVRRPSVHSVFGVDKGPGFCEVICGKATLKEAVQAAHPEGLFVLSAGTACRQAIYRMVHDDVTKLLDEAKRKFDIVVVDSAPVLAVADSMQLAPNMDSVMFSIRRDVSRLSNVSAAVQRLEMLNVPIMGAVAIGLDPTGSGSRYGRYYAYHNKEYPEAN